MKIINHKIKKQMLCDSFLVYVWFVNHFIQIDVLVQTLIFHLDCVGTTARIHKKNERITRIKKEIVERKEHIKRTLIRTQSDVWNRTELRERNKWKWHLEFENALAFEEWRCGRTNETNRRKRIDTFDWWFMTRISFFLLCCIKKS